MTDYASYLESDQWLERRAYMLRRLDYRCALCGSRTHLDVHHRTYDRIGREFDADLIVLCRECHARHHHKLVPEPVSLDPTPTTRADVEVVIDYHQAQAEAFGAPPRNVAAWRGRCREEIEENERISPGHIARAAAGIRRDTA